jgi:uncharacterized repeat protein (TIGR01451 family)
LSVIVALLLSTLFLINNFLLSPAPVRGNTTELFFSEYIEGSSNNKALEIYNGTGAPINLATAGYNIQMFFNGNPVSTLTINLTGTVADGDVFVIAQSLAGPDILAQADQTNGSGWFNGDDAVVLRKGSTIIDVIGQVGNDPGTEWGSGLTSTADNTLRRKSAVCAGDTIPNDAFNPATEWDGFANDTFGGLGSHAANCGGPPALSINDVSMAEGDAGTTIFSFNVSLSSAAGAGGVTFTVNTADGITNPANAGSDYAAIVNGSGSIGEGNTATTINVTVNGDPDVEPSETFFVNITNVSGANLLDGQGLGTITNDDVAITPIHDIQGAGGTSPFTGNSVTTEAIVTARKGNGFFIQMPDNEVDTDADAAETSEAVFVFTSSGPTVAVGDKVRVTGTVVEFKRAADQRPDTLTEISAPLTIVVISQNNTLPTALTSSIFNPNAPSRSAQLEKQESMLVEVSSITVVAPTNDFGEFFGVVTGQPRPFREPGIEVSLPIPPEAPSPMTIDRFDGNYERIMVDSDEVLNAGGTRRAALHVTTGAVVADTSGPLDYAFDNYRIVLDVGAGILVSEGITSAVPAPVRTTDEFTIGSLNVENFFPPNPNNAAQVAAFNNRLNKVSLLIRDVLRLPDILGIIEVGDEATLAQIAGKVNEIAGTNYEAHLEEGIDGGGNDQDVGYLVNLDRVQVVGTPVQAFKGKTFTFNGVDDILHDRPPYILEADVLKPNSTQKVRVTVILNHLRSLIDIESPTAGERVREKRRLQAEDVADLIQGRQGENLVVLGDLNAFEFNDGYVDVVGTLKGTPAPAEEVVEPSMDRWTYELINLGDGLQNDQQYSFVFEGSAQALDHVLVSGEMNSRLTRFAYTRTNADFSESFASDPNRPERLSDHDAPVAYFMFPPDVADLAVSKSASSSSIVTGSNVTYTITVTNNGPDTATSVVVSDQLPAGLAFVSCNSTGGGVCGGTGNNRTVTFESLAANTSADITIVATVDCALTDGTQINNTATVSSATGDSDPDNHSFSVGITASNPAPVISGVAVDKTSLWPANHDMMDVNVSYNTQDNCGPVTCTLSVTSNEPVEGLGDGDMAPDWEVVDDHHVRLRAERSGNGNGRVYTITITCVDNAGRSSSQSVTVTVPKSQK